MKKQTLFFILLGFPLILFAQHKPNSLSIQTGAAFAIGDYHKSDLKNNGSGFANTGEMVRLNWTHGLQKSWHLLVSLGGQRNPLNHSAFEEQLNKTPLNSGVYALSDPNQIPVVTGTVYPNWSVKKSAWLLGDVQIGVQKNFAINKTTSVTLAGTAGYAMARSAELSATSQTDTTLVVITQDKKKGSGVAFSTRAGIETAISKKCFFTAGFHYVSTADMTFKNVQSNMTIVKGKPGDPGYSAFQSMHTADGKQMMQSVNIVVGIGVKL